MRWPERERVCRAAVLRAARQQPPFHLVVQWFHIAGRNASDAALEQKQRDLDDALRLNAALQTDGLLARPLHILLESAADAEALRQRVPSVFVAPHCSCRAVHHRSC